MSLNLVNTIPIKRIPLPNPYLCPPCLIITPAHIAQLTAYLTYACQTHAAICPLTVPNYVISTYNYTFLRCGFNLKIGRHI
jgi:hypothetical protein